MLRHLTFFRLRQENHHVASMLPCSKEALAMYWLPCVGLSLRKCFLSCFCPGSAPSPTYFPAVNISPMLLNVFRLRRLKTHVPGWSRHCTPSENRRRPSTGLSMTYGSGTASLKRASGSQPLRSSSIEPLSLLLKPLWFSLRWFRIRSDQTA